MVPHPPIILPEVGRGEEKKISQTNTAYEKAVHKPNGVGTEFLHKDEWYHLRRKAELTIYQ